MKEFLLDLLNYIKVRKKFWLLPIIIFLSILGGLLFVGQGSVLSPFIYTIF
jgi:hypothetical protein